MSGQDSLQTVSESLFSESDFLEEPYLEPSLQTPYLLQQIEIDQDYSMGHFAGTTLDDISAIFVFGIMLGFLMAMIPMFCGLCLKVLYNVFRKGVKS